MFDVRAAPVVAPVPGRSQRESDPEARLDAYLDEVASRKPWLSRSDDPVLVREPDGSLSHEGNGFDAVIEPDGRVRFDDKYLDFDLNFKPMVSPDGTVTISLFKVTMAIDVWIDKLFGKGDPFRAERRWFLERTAQLREERIQKHWQRVAKEGVTALRHKLQDIWHDANLDIPRRKALTFAHWDGCADDEVGVLGKAVVEGFVRERLPSGSRWAFQQDELSALNAKRKSRAPFAPYAP